jgi:hypothetical protein
MKRSALLLALAACVPFGQAMAQHIGTPTNEFTGKLLGIKEVPAVSTAARGEFRSYVHGDHLHYLLRYTGLEGNVTQAHVHLGQPGVNGGVMLWLCSNLPSPPPGTPACPPSPATVTGILEADDVVGPAGQLVMPGELDEAIRAMLKGVTYANVHTDLVPSGEIRSKVNPP